MFWFASAFKVGGFHPIDCMNASLAQAIGPAGFFRALLDVAKRSAPGLRNRRSGKPGCVSRPFSALNEGVLSSMIATSGEAPPAECSKPHGADGTCGWAKDQVIVSQTSAVFE